MQSDFCVRICSKSAVSSLSDRQFPSPFLFLRGRKTQLSSNVCVMGGLPVYLCLPIQSGHAFRDCAEAVTVSFDESAFQSQPNAITRAAIRGAALIRPQSRRFPHDSTAPYCARQVLIHGVDKRKGGCPDLDAATYLRAEHGLRKARGAKPGTGLFAVCVRAGFERKSHCAHLLAQCQGVSSAIMSACSS